MVEQFEILDSSLLAVQQVPLQQTNQYGILGTTPFSKMIERVEKIVEKPDPAVAPSTLAVVGRYILTPAIFDRLQNIKKGYGGEIQLTDGIASLLHREPVYAYRYSAKRYDCGSKLGYLQAMLDLGLRHPEVGPSFSEYVVKRMQPTINEL
jgi:UTP--glucose-1-phosphate uridylyltransferase